MERISPAKLELRETGFDRGKGSARSRFDARVKDREKKGYEEHYEKPPHRGLDLALLLRGRNRVESARPESSGGIMKKYLFLLVLILASLSQAAEEESSVLVIDENVTNYGLQVGLNFSNASVGAGVPTSGRAGFQIGALMEAPLTPGLLYLQPELSLVQRGAETGSFGPLVKTRLNYLEVGLLAKVKITVAEVKPFALAGPRFGYLLSASGENGGVSLDRSSFSSADFGIDIGGGVAFAMSDRSEVLLTARYSFGLIDADPSAQSWKSEAFLLSVGYLF